MVASTAMSKVPGQVRLVGDSTMLVQVQARPGHVEMTTQIHAGITSSNVFAADCAVALERLGSPTFRFVQLHPVKDDVAARILHVRFTWEAFRRQAKIVLPFREKVEAALEATAAPSEASPGRFAALARSVTTDASTQSLILDADFDYTAHHGSRCSILYLDMDPRETAGAAQGRLEEIRIQAVVSVTLPSVALIDMITSWESMLPKEAP